MSEVSAGVLAPAERAREPMIDVDQVSPEGELAPRRFAPIVEMLAVGGLGLLVFPLSWMLRGALGLETAELAVGFTMFHAAHFLNDPHFAVTYLLFYERAGERLTSERIPRAQRVRYAIAGIVAPLVLVGWAAAAIVTRSAQLLGWMVQLMFLLVGWHYAKQGFGVLTVLSMRRGVRFAELERRVILAHCYAAWAFAWANPSSPAGEFEERGVVYWAPAHPAWIETSTAIALAVSVLALIVVLVRRVKRGGAVPLVPLMGFVVTIWLWTIFTRLDPLVAYVIPALHSLQYGWFVWRVKRNEAAAKEGPPTFGPPARTKIAWLAFSACLLGWVLFRSGPWVLDTALVPSWPDDDATLALGVTPFFAAFYVVVNLHHYVMDFVIWRRESPETRYLAIEADEPVEAGE